MVVVVGSALPSTDLAVARLDDPVVSRGVREKIVVLPREVLPGVRVVVWSLVRHTSWIGLSMVGVVTGALGGEGAGDGELPYFQSRRRAPRIH